MQITLMADGLLETGVNGLLEVCRREEEKIMEVEIVGRLTGRIIVV